MQILNFLRPNQQRIISALIFFTLLISITSLAKPLSPKIADPLAPGPYAVGVTTTVLVDKNRTDAFTKEPRTLVTEIWYPATDEARKKPTNKYSDFIPTARTAEIDRIIQQAYRLPIAELDKIFWNFSVRDAEVQKGKFPVIIFSHGNGGSRHQNTFWCDYLASHGYIIVSADHTANARFTIINGKIIPYQISERLHSASDRPQDMSFLLDEMTRWNQGADKRFAGKLDLSKVVAAGMSFGSMTAIRVADQDSRFKVVIAMSGAPPTRTNLMVPSLLMLGTEDRTIGENGNDLIRSHHSKHQGPSFLLELKNGGHYSFTDIFKISKNFGDGAGSGKRRLTDDPFSYTSMEKTYQIINSYSLAFLGVYVKGERKYQAFLQKNYWPDELIWKSTGMAGSTKTNP